MVKNTPVILLCALLVFIGLVSGVFIGRLTRGEDILLEYQRGSVLVQPTTEPQVAIAETFVSEDDLGKININTATLAQLMTLDNIGEVIASRIIAYRTEHGPFTSIEELLNVEGIGPTRFENIRDDITVGG